MAAGLTLLLGGLLLGFADITRVGVLLAALPLLAGLVLGVSPGSSAVISSTSSSSISCRPATAMALASSKSVDDDRTLI